jgi:hypothetical protein
MLGGPILLAALAATSVGSVVWSLARGRRPGVRAVAGTAGLAAYIAAVRPWLEGWGATAEERAKALPGDELVPGPASQTTRAVTVEAPVEDVWPWVAQIGQDRGGFYSYEWLENLAGCRMQNAERIHPEWQQRRVGETVLLHPASGLELARFEPDRCFAFAGWYLVLEPANGFTRLIARGRFPRGATSLAYASLLELPHFIMERKMLLGIKARAERSRAAGGA